MLPYSNWEWATICHSESLLSLRHGVQEALFRLGRVPEYHQTDNSTGATHNLSEAEKQEGAKGTRGFNADYLALMNHYGMKPRTIKVGAKEQNGDVESSNRHLKRKLKQRLILRGSRDFDSLESYQQWLNTAIDAFNSERAEKVQVEREHMTRFDKAPLPIYLEKKAKVNKGSNITVLGRVYSVPSRLIGHTVRARVYDRHLEVDHDGVLQLQCERIRGPKYSRIDYRHIIWSLIRKPGAFARYRYREEMFPSLIFRQAFDEISSSGNIKHTDLEYLRILHIAAAEGEHLVEQALEKRLAHDLPITFDEVRMDLQHEMDRGPAMAPAHVDLVAYDELCQGVTQ